MESVLVKNHYSSIQECLNWANEMIGNEIPGYDWLIADAISNFQIIMHSGESYTIIVLVRATGKAA
jgi:hypothetical protein